MNERELKFIIGNLPYEAVIELTKNAGGATDIDGLRRWTYEQFFGPIPPGADVYPTCESSDCYRPGHLGLFGETE